MNPVKKLDYIDALRGLAILSVIMVHCSQNGTFNIKGPLAHFIVNGARGVQLFYVASAFTLFLSMKNRFHREKSPFKNFYLRRFFRIAPMYYIGILYYLIQDGFGERYWLGDAKSISFQNILSNITFLHGFNPYWITSLVPGGWTIAVEMTFYTILPFLFLRIRNINHAFYFFIVSILVRLILSLLLTKFPLISSERLWREYLFIYFPNNLPVFALGILMYFCIEEHEKLLKISAKSFLTFSILLIAQLATASNLIFPSHVLFGFAFLILGISLSRFKPLLIVNPIINYIGKISFSMYLVHFSILHWLVRFNLVDYFDYPLINYATRFIIVTACSVLVSTIFYNLIELPFQKIGKRIIDRSEQKKNKKETEVAASI